MSKYFLLAAFFAVLTAVGGMLAIPMPLILPFTMQTFVVIMSGLLLGKKFGAISQILYISMGLIGLPVFAKGTGGIHHLLSPTFGFLIGFVLVSWFAGALGSRARTTLHYCLVCLASTATLYLVAIPYFYVSSNFILGAEITLERAMQIVLLPFIVPDIIKAIGAGFLASRTIPMLRQMDKYKSQHRDN